MDAWIWIFIIIPIAYAVGMKVFRPHKITFTEMTIMGTVTVLMSLAVYHGGRFSAASDVELWNGQVVSVTDRRESCPFGWRDYKDNFCREYRTRSVPDGTKTCDKDGKNCRANYKTQYNYDYPWERSYYVTLDLKDRVLEIAREDAQGRKEPARWLSANVGDPASITNKYDNWVRAASESIFHEDGAVSEHYADLIPEYPINIVDYHRVNRVIGVGVNVEQAWNEELSLLLRELGPAVQMNAIIMLADANLVGSDFIYAVRRAWMGFKKNDAVVFIGINPNGTVAWSDTLSWSKEERFNVEMRNAVLEQRDQPLNMMAVLDNLHTIGMEHYQRRPMKEFEFLKAQIPTPTWVIVLVVFFSIGGSLGLSILFDRHHLSIRDIFKR